VRPAMIDDLPSVEREFGRLFTGQGNLVLAVLGDDQEAVVAAAEELRLAGAGPVPVDLFDPLGPTLLREEPFLIGSLICFRLECNPGNAGGASEVWEIRRLAA
jgi:hypothetical protein